MVGSMAVDGGTDERPKNPDSGGELCLRPEQPSRGGALAHLPSVWPLAKLKRRAKVRARSRPQHMPRAKYAHYVRSRRSALAPTYDLAAASFHRNQTGGSAQVMNAWSLPSPRAPMLELT